MDVPRYQESMPFTRNISRPNGALAGIRKESNNLRSTIAYDAYYIRNWSLWMDIHRIPRTIGVVIRGTAPTRASLWKFLLASAIAIAPNNYLESHHSSAASATAQLGRSVERSAFLFSTNCCCGSYLPSGC